MASALPVQVADALHAFYEIKASQSYFVAGVCGSNGVCIHTDEASEDDLRLWDPVPKRVRLWVCSSIEEGVGVVRVYFVFVVVRI